MVVSIKLKFLVIVSLIFFFSLPLYGRSVVPEILKPLNITNSRIFGDFSTNFKIGEEVYKENPEIIEYLEVKLEPELDKLLKKKFIIQSKVSMNNPTVDYKFMRSSAKLLSSLGIYLAHIKKPKESLTCFRTCIKLGVVLSRAGFLGTTNLIQKMISIAVVKIGMANLYKVIYLYPQNSKSLIKFNSFLLNIREKIIPMAPVVKQEYVWLMNIAETMGNDPTFKGYSKVKIQKYVKGIQKYFDKDVKPLMDMYVKICERKFWKPGKINNEYYKKEDELLKSCKINYWNPKNWWTAVWDKPYIISRILISIAYPNFSRARAQDTAMFAMIDGFSIAIVTKLYKQKKGKFLINISKFPKLKEIKYNKDPFTGENYIIEIENNELLLYSQASWKVFLINGVELKKEFSKL